MDGTTACATQKVGRRIEPSASSKCSSVCSVNGTGRKMPVLLTSTSTTPKRSTAAATRACARSRWATCPATISVRSPVGSSSAWAASRTSRRVPLSTTWAPSWRNRRAAARPMPPPPPVMRMILSSNRCMCINIHASAPNASAVIYTNVSGIGDETLATWRAFLNAHARITRAISRDLAAAGLPDLSVYDVLWALYKRPRRVNELADAVVLSPTAMSRFVDRLERDGYVRREGDPADRRALQITITDEGRRLLRRMWPV